MKEEKPVKLLSTGQPSTLGTYRKLSCTVFGEDSKAVKFLDDKIAKQGEGEIVLADERQMLYLLNSLHLGES